MTLRKSSWLVMVLVLALTLTACNIGATPQPTVDVGAIYTAAAQTAIADLSLQMTATAMAASPTPQPTATLPPPTATNTLAPNLTPFATTGPMNTLPAGTPGGIFTPIASVAPPQGTASGPLCDNSAFVADITVPDGTVMQPGEDFYKIWRLQNTGTCTWDEGYQLAFAWGDPLDGQPFTIQQKDDFVLPGATADFGIHMTAHLKPGEYSGCWRMKNDRGSFFGAVVCVNIKVVKN